MEALERPLVRMLEVPLTCMAPHLFIELEQLFMKYKAAALERRRDYSMVRRGVEWLVGHESKRGGPPQSKLICFGFKRHRGGPSGVNDDGSQREDLGITCPIPPLTARLKSQAGCNKGHCRPPWLALIALSSARLAPLSLKRDLSGRAKAPD